MKTTILFIHGYGSDRNSRKFQELKSYFTADYDLHCMEWAVYSDIPWLLNDAVEKCAVIRKLIIIGDSTGANFAWQIREMRNSKEDKLILLSPLLDVSKRKRDVDFPDVFNQYLVKIENPENALVIASANDEVVDMKSLFEEPDKKFTLLKVHDGHRLEKFEKYLQVVEKFIRNGENLSTTK